MMHGLAAERGLPLSRLECDATYVAALCKFGLMALCAVLIAAVDQEASSGERRLARGTVEALFVVLAVCESHVVCLDHLVASAAYVHGSVLALTKAQVHTINERRA